MNDTQAQARPVRPTLEEVEAYVHGKGYDVPGAANAFYGNFFYAYHDARVWRRADGTPVADWRAEADTWHERGPHYLEPKPRAKGLDVPEGAADIAVPAGWRGADEPDAARAVRFLSLSGAQGAAWAVETDGLASSRAAAGTRGSASHPPETGGASSTCRYRITP